MKDNKSKKLTVRIPRGFMNCCVTKDNHFVADTNNSANWDKLKFPLPSGNWQVYDYSKQGTEVILERVV